MRTHGRQHAAGPGRVFEMTILAASLCAATGAWAQDTAGSEPAARGTVQEVIVTAERHRSPVQKTAASITALTGEELRDKGQTTVESALRNVTGVEVQASPQGGQLFIRGVGANGDSNWVDPSVALMFDNVYSGRAERVFASMYDVDRVEVLRGPQGTLYGRNATGGTVNVITRNPVFAREGAFNLQVGDYGLRHGNAALNVPVNDALALRVALLREKRDGYFSNGAVASDLTGARVKVLMKPTPALSLLATVDTIENKGAGATTAAYSYSADVPPFVTWPTYPGGLSDPWQVDGLHPAEERKARFTTWSLEANWDLGWGNLTLIPAYTTSHRYLNTNLITGIAVPPGLAASVWEENQATAELRIASAPRAATRWVAGLYHFKTDNTQTGTVPQSGVPTWETYGVSVPTRSDAIFAQLTQPVSATLRVTAGARYTRDARRENYGVRSLVGGYDSGILSARNDYSAVNYKAGIEYDLAPASMLYAQVASGYKAGGFSTTTTPPVAYAPEKLTAFELGSKNRFLGGRLQLNAELYYYLYKNYQVQYQDYGAPSPNPDDAPGSVYFAQYVVNADTGRNRGGEAELRYRMTPDDEIGIALAFADARYGSFAQPQLAWVGSTPVANTPRRTAHLSYKHDWYLASGARLTFNVTTKLSDGYRVALTQGLPGGDQHLWQPGYRRSDLYLTRHSPDEAWTAGLWVRNLENRAQVANALPFGRVQITDPRTVGANLGYTF